MRLIIFILFLIVCSCEKQSPLIKKETSGAIGNELALDITARVVRFESMGEKFKVIAVLENELPLTVFAIGDTLSLYPNFIRSEGSKIDMESMVNQKMAKLQTLPKGSTFKALIKLRGMAKKQHGLIMSWSH